MCSVTRQATALKRPRPVPNPTKREDEGEAWEGTEKEKSHEGRPRRPASSPRGKALGRLERTARKAAGKAEADCEGRPGKTASGQRGKAPGKTATRPMSETQRQGGPGGGAPPGGVWGLHPQGYRHALTVSAFGEHSSPERMERPPRQGEERGGRRGSPQALTGGVSASRLLHAHAPRARGQR
jgi:hypothetical protein